MHSASLDAITDIEILRAVIRDQREAIAGRDAEITKRDAVLAELDAEITRRDAVIAKHETVLGKRDREIRFKDAKIEQLAQAIAKFQRLQFAARSEKFDPT